ncbi:quaternary ammonium compound efflux SMR transporter SugE [Nostoc sp. FACHB-152]|uniref:quaternary ammonium compound efflux SMR transporter SugE n=1 Tax=unclassified Nostoc TaxID=2593658 RepID=UPI00168651DE|nr:MULTISPECIES: quaternary ammonium compound efflux SMR transporter SugE [unclassified Nostoc]MBD2449401.1 quaternary ammonium compound efflux SMR transporter SugE [Nostoc sp. FACHB-152]MBD2470684.1 quaternary ammonium compound efflux SMR transporter SugE [Nostoc sp. FACHB-145]
MAWVYLLIAGLLEIAWAIGLKYSQGFTKLAYSIPTVACMVLSFFFLSIALRTLPVGTAYAVWTGIGAMGTALLGVILLGEPASMKRFICIGLILAGVLGLRLVSNH